MSGALSLIHRYFDETQNKYFCEIKNDCYDAIPLNAEYGFIEKNLKKNIFLFSKISYSLNDPQSEKKTSSYLLNDPRTVLVYIAHVNLP